MVNYMPIYEYQAYGQANCDHCKAVFDVMQKMSDEPLKICPDCHNPVRRKISRPNLASQAPSLSEENIEKHGLTQFKKVEKGVYEKTAGTGPDYIMDDKTS
jgi:putative FmdB family regulatory protein